jgi:acetylglutamate kinase
MDPRSDPESTAEVLTQALPYIQRFTKRTVVVKYGGHAMTDPALARLFADDIVLMQSVGIRPVVIHGGGPQIGDLMARLGKEATFKQGLRVTDSETLDIARMVLVGKINRDIVSSINVHGSLAVGVSGEDGGLIRASARDPELGFVGDIESVDPTLVDRLLAESLIPVISTIGADAAGQAYNINADTVAGGIAAALGAEKLIMLTDVDGLRSDPEDPASLVARATAAEVEAMIADGTAVGGMIPKLEAAVAAVRGGVASAHLVDGTRPHVLLLELFTDAGIGTMITTGETP